MKRPSRRFWLLLLKIGGALYILYLLVGFFALPKVIDHVLENRVSDQLDRSITLEKASFNPFTLSLELIGLKVEDDDGHTFVEVGRIFSNPQLFPLLTRRVSVKEFALSDTIIRLKLETDGTLNIEEAFQVDASWLEQLAKVRTTRVKDYLVATKGIDASRVFISGKVSNEETEEKSKPVSAVKFELTD